MVSKLDELRSGKAVEIEPGLIGKLDFNEKKLILSNGKKLDASRNPDYFPQNEEQLSHSREKELQRKAIKTSPLGEFGFQLGEKGVFGAAQDWLTFKGDEYLKKKKVRNELSQEISEESPFTSGAATVASFVPDVALTHGLGAGSAGALLATAHAGPRILEEPGQVAKEALISGVGSYFLGKGANWLGKTAARRGLSRKVAAENEQIPLLNAEKRAETELANQESRNSFNSIQEAANRENQALQHQANLSSQQYKKSLEDLPRLQREAQEKYGQNVIKNAEDIEQSFHPQANISPTQLQVGEFIESHIPQMGLAGTNQERLSKKIIRSIFPEGKSVASKELANKYRALESSIARAEPEVANVLTKFKEHLGERLPYAMADDIAYREVFPSFRSNLEKNVEDAVRKLKIGKNENISEMDLIKKAKSNLDKYFESVNSENFVEKMTSGEISKNIKSSILNEKDFLHNIVPPSHLKKLEERGLSNYIGKSEAYKKRVKDYERFSSEIGRKIDNQIAANELKMFKASDDAFQKLSGKIEKTYGSSPNLEPPIAPELPKFTSMPSPPIEQKFVPQNPTILPKAENTADLAGDFLEKKLLSGRGVFNNPLTKIAGLKYALGKGALPVEAGYAALKGLTSPTAAGAVARKGFRELGIQSIVQLAQRYPSYHDGILEDPRDRRSLSKQIEDDPEIPLEEKAVIQSKVHRGKRLEERL